MRHTASDGEMGCRSLTCLSERDCAACRFVRTLPLRFAIPFAIAAHVQMGQQALHLTPTSHPAHTGNALWNTLDTTEAVTGGLQPSETACRQGRGWHVAQNANRLPAS